MADILSKLELWSTLDEGTGTNASDSSGNNHNGTLTLGPTWVAGRVGPGSVHFDGTNDNITYGDVNNLDGLQTLTVAAWINPDRINVSFQHIFGKDDNAGNGWRLQTGEVGGPTGSPSGLLALIGKTGTFGGGFTSTAGGLIAVGTWTHVAMVFDGTQTGDANRLKLYVNGVSQSITFGIGAIPDTASANASNVVLAFSNDAADNYFKGNIDEFRCYTRALTQAEITALWLYPNFQLSLLGAG